MPSEGAGDARTCQSAFPTFLSQPFLWPSQETGCLNWAENLIICNSQAWEARMREGRGTRLQEVRERGTEWGDKVPKREA